MNNEKKQKVDYAAIALGLAQIAMQIYEDYRESHTGENIPPWDEIATKNALLQVKIDADKPV